MRFSFLIVLVLFFFHQVFATNNQAMTPSLMARQQANAPMAMPSQRKRAPTIWASPEILQNGTLFYVAISISTLLWCTGKGVDMTLDQQQRQAEFAACR
ncbi:uncharacterized protein BX664DRAFT_323290 [Halteromyces radiatus]|uniref:uncharacterized protein n=1 Tax=Halteromyces radiatus TaxID=101107 RepID=UPI00221E74EA|nr:uncharacterized protein BX664DRAFT_323290 [Halteromyces radiatus]KAI8096173.1 hypothetical protein BX664DRAFT_323290 [Halteromyces radiatus]